MLNEFLAEVSVIKLYLWLVSFISFIFVATLLCFFHPRKVKDRTLQNKNGKIFFERFFTDKTLFWVFSVSLLSYVLIGPNILPILFLCGLKFFFLSLISTSESSKANNKEEEENLGNFEVFYLFVFGVYMYLIDGQKNKIHEIDVCQFFYNL